MAQAYTHIRTLVDCYTFTGLLALAFEIMYIINFLFVVSLKVDTTFENILGSEFLCMAVCFVQRDDINIVNDIQICSY